MSRRRVAHLTSSHTADDPRVFGKECRSLVAAGYDVCLVVPDRGGERIVDGVRIVGVRRARGRFGRLVVGPMRVLVAGWRQRADVYHFHDPELIPAALLLALAGRSVVYDSHEDLVRKVAARRWIPRLGRGLLARTLGGLERLAARRFAAVISAEPAAVERFRRADVAVVQNYALESELDRVMTAGPGTGSTVTYVGSISEDRGALAMARLAGRLGDRAEVVVAGAAAAGLATRMEAAAAPARLALPGWIGRDEVGALLSRTSVGLLLLQPIRQYREATQPVKLFEYLGAGVPVVASDFPVLRAIVGTTRAGLLVDPTDDDAVFEAVTWLLDHPDEAAEMGERGRAAVRRDYTWRSQAEILGAVYRRLVG